MRAKPVTIERTTAAWMLAWIHYLVYHAPLELSGETVRALEEPLKTQLTALEVVTGEDGEPPIPVPPK